MFSLEYPSNRWWKAKDILILLEENFVFSLRLLHPFSIAHRRVALTSNHPFASWIFLLLYLLIEEPDELFHGERKKIFCYGNFLPTFPTFNGAMKRTPLRKEERDVVVIGCDTIAWVGGDRADSKDCTKCNSTIWMRSKKSLRTRLRLQKMQIAMEEMKNGR